ncbi:MAG: hypothetical protein HC886_21195 [Leptolyngbyaceae cyanobacterium SM1_1_3]|nr:hypothetical protein [Leptolyngbyaceae cyanobacterium SM1_1_3]NJN01247.1 hypothetical protein [Leptolyngbyaceae cyanobacterium RM1_1_2]NJO12058.1 hypothetical protein [Leptolyngbyaceae cyanobacterium SL_1_1]
MNASLLRLLWSRIEKTPADILTRLGNDGLVQYLLSQIKDDIYLSPEEYSAVGSYISARSVLIRDLAYSRAA